MEYRCRLGTPGGEIIEGVYVADSEARLRREFEEKGLYVLAIQQAGRRALAMYGAVWALLSWLGLSWIYVISHYEYSVYLDSSKARVVATLVVGAAALTPLLAGEAWASARGRDRPHAGAARTSSPPRESANSPLRARPR